MEIPVINRMTEFDSLNNPYPSLITRMFSILELGKMSFLPHRLFKWGALFLALAYAFTSLACKLKSMILHYHTKSKSILASASEPLLSHFDDEDDFSSSSDEDEDESISSSPSSSDDEEVEEEEEEEDGNGGGITASLLDDFIVKGSLRLRRGKSAVFDNFSSSLSELVSGRNGVVKLWENSILGEIPFPETTSFSQEVVLSGSSDGCGALGVGLWDLRMGCRVGGSKSGRDGASVRVDSGRTGKVYVRSDVTGLTAVADVRMVDAPLEKLTEDKWLDAE